METLASSSMMHSAITVSMDCARCRQYSSPTSRPAQISATAINVIKTIEVGFLNDCRLLATASSRLNGDVKYTVRSADGFKSSFQISVPMSEYAVEGRYPRESGAVSFLSDTRDIASFG